MTHIQHQRIQCACTPRTTYGLADARCRSFALARGSFRAVSSSLATRSQRTSGWAQEIEDNVVIWM
eukprot:362108-Chlamydomonas_euryale.AAC.1